jgi:transposase
MRGYVEKQIPMFSVIQIDPKIRKNHPLRPIAELVDAILEALSPDFDRIYAKTGRPSIPPEHLLKALLIQILYTIRSEAQLLEHLEFNLLYRWFVGLAPDADIWDETVFSKNRERLLDGDIAQKFFKKVVELAESRGLLSHDHFTVDGTQLHAWASHKSFRPKGENDSPDNNDSGNRSVDFHGQRRTNATHESTTDPESRLYRKSNGAESKLSYLGHALMENRNGLVVNARVTRANGTAERDVVPGFVVQLDGEGRKTVGGDKGYDTKDFVATMRQMNVTPHVAQNTSSRSSAIDDRTARHLGYELSQRKRKLIEQSFGWMKTVGPMRRPHRRGLRQMEWWFRFSAAAYNLVRIRNLTAQPA